MIYRGKNIKMQVRNGKVAASPVLCWEKALPFIRGRGLRWGTPSSLLFSPRQAALAKPPTLILPAESPGWEQTRERHMFCGKRGNNQVRVDSCK